MVWEETPKNNKSSSEQAGGSKQKSQPRLLTIQAKPESKSKENSNSMFGKKAFPEPCVMGEESIMVSG